ncbi:MAG: sigma-70 family RNA polymerase sigma factor [Lachnospiraceae bacterium]|nr:sigma-70 family RNA polymerase sigma factor [Lachnospiraceae bacterium]
MQYNTELPVILHDRDKTDEFIKQHKSFIASCAYKATGRFVTESDDAFQVAMIAFYEAMEKYDDSKGGFLSFASLVIKRRLIDDLEKQKRHSLEIPADLGSDHDVGDDVPDALSSAVKKGESAAAAAAFESRQASDDLKDEIAELSAVLAGYGFSFYDLTKCSPVSYKTKQACAAVIDIMQRQPGLIFKMKQNKALPIKELMNITGVKRKVLERHRRYLIAVAEIMTGEYDRLRDYIPRYP